jgi:hypothetical protein
MDDTEAISVRGNSARLRRRRIRGLVFLCALALAISSCATQPRPEAYDAPGFFYGLLHGFLILFSFIGSLFTEVRVYAFPNSGGWYDFGYLLGVAIFFWGGAAAGSGY